jgi:hypothetical protein
MSVGSRWAIGSRLAFGALVVTFALYLLYGRSVLGGGNFVTTFADVLYDTAANSYAFPELIGSPG